MSRYQSIVIILLLSVVTGCHAPDSSPRINRVEIVEQRLVARSAAFFGISKEITYINEESIKDSLGVVVTGTKRDLLIDVLQKRAKEFDGKIEPSGQCVQLMFSEMEDGMSARITLAFHFDEKLQLDRWKIMHEFFQP
jgi:hypothetical protein